MFYVQLIMGFIINILIGLVLGFLFIVFLYLFLAIVLRYISINSNKVNQSEGCMKIYFTSNGAHTDTVFPISHEWMKEVTWFRKSDFEINEEDKYVGVGWGDRGFYLDIPEWKDLTPMVAIKALFLRAPTLMHVTVQPTPKYSKRVKSIYITKDQFDLLQKYIHSWFIKKNEDIVLIEGGFSPKDQFYAAKGNYSMILTCNEWTNRGLKKMKHRTVLWAPFAGSVLEQLPSHESEDSD